MDRELWKKTFVMVAAMLGAWLVVVGGLTIVAVGIASHAVAPAESAHEESTTTNEAAKPVIPTGATRSPRGPSQVPSKGHDEAI